MLTSSFGCGIETADMEFKFTRDNTKGKSPNLAHHLIQSFEPGETTQEEAHEIGMSMAELAISFVRDTPGVTSLVLGADSPEHIAENVSYINAPSLSPEMRAEISKAFESVDMTKIMELLSRPKK